MKKSESAVLRHHRAHCVEKKDGLDIYVRQSVDPAAPITDDELRRFVRVGPPLMKTSERPALPETIIFANTGVLLPTGDDERILGILRKLDKKGVRLMICSRLVSTADDIINTILSSSNVLKMHSGMGRAAFG